jgi:hypothetical protein
MEKDTLRMQFLSGVITEGQYKEKLKNINEIALIAAAVASLPVVASLILGFNLDQGIKNLLDKAREIKDEKKREKEIAKIRQIEAEVKKESAEIKASPEYSKAQSDSELQSLIKQYNESTKYSTLGDYQSGSEVTFGIKDKEIANKIIEKISNEYPTLKKVIEREILADLKDIRGGGNFKLEEKDSLNESMIGGIVGIGAINQIPPRAKADYETAFEHFLGEKYGLNEVEMEEGNLGHNEMYSIEPEGHFWIVTYTDMDGKKEKVFQSEEDAKDFVKFGINMEEGKEGKEGNEGKEVEDEIETSEEYKKFLDKKMHDLLNKITNDPKLLDVFKRLKDK